MLRRVVTSIATLLVVTSVAAQTPSQQDLIAGLKSATPSARDAALQQIARIPPEQRHTELWLAVVDELQRLTKESQDRDDLLTSGKELPALGMLGGVEGYLQELITVVGEWRDPRVLPALISAPGDGMIITEPIVRFGDAAVPGLIDAVRHGRRSQLTGSLLALQYLIEGLTAAPYSIPPANLSPQSREAIMQLARDLLRPTAVNRPDAQSIDPVQRGIAARLMMHETR